MTNTAEQQRQYAQARKEAKRSRKSDGQNASSRKYHAMLMSEAEKIGAIQKHGYSVMKQRVDLMVAKREAFLNDNEDLRAFERLNKAGPYFETAGMTKEQALRMADYMAEYV